MQQLFDKLKEPKNIKIIGISVCAIAASLIVLKQYFKGGVCKVKRDLSNKVAVVTGGNTGIGKETVEQLLRCKCKVIFGSRKVAKSQQVVKELQNKIPGADVKSFALDLSNKDSIQMFAQNVKQSCTHIDYLINNAGVMLVPKRTTTDEGFEFQMGVNHFGHFYLSYLLIDELKKAEFFRIINVSSKANTRSGSSIDFDDIHYQHSYKPFVAYQRSKMANVLFTKQLQRKITQNRLNGISVSLHPGAVDTQLPNTYFDGRKYLLTLLYVLFFIPIKVMMKTPKQGAQTTLYTIFEEADKLQGGAYYADCKVAKEGQQGRDEESAKRLWRVSENLLGIKFNL